MNMLKKLAASASVFAIGTGIAAAQAFDPAPVTTSITTNVGIAVGIVGAFIAGIWTLRTMGLLKGRG